VWHVAVSVLLLLTLALKK
jgi:hypothetical protein